MYKNIVSLGFIMELPPAQTWRNKQISIIQQSLIAKGASQMPRPGGQVPGETPPESHILFRKNQSWIIYFKQLNVDFSNTIYGLPLPHSAHKKPDSSILGDLPAFG